jgi:hypothetical protein
MMKVHEGSFMEARYAEIAVKMYGDWDLLWENSEVDYQGYVEFLATKEGKYVYLEWSYGSCSHCDEWEDLSDEEVESSMRKLAMEFANVELFKVYAERLVAASTASKAEEWLTLVNA